jgi:class 3 adenylate cyclase
LSTESATILFTDQVGLTELSQRRSAVDGEELGKVV